MAEFGRYGAIRTTLSSQTITGQAVCIKSGAVRHQYDTGRLGDVQVICARSDSIIRPTQAAADSVLFRSGQVQYGAGYGFGGRDAIWQHIAEQFRGLQFATVYYRSSMD